ncbi:MAG: nuclear transport factor 2 family protein [Gammaproteobacteria bacterium]|jgi:hypothetical protein|nr:nuclear transport factor 2 family protein [Gammaproteobacteria bacterium]MBT4492178.1 nuclear transport factor 2 family protein [Gammaproteobacteria bacterium]MBT7369694.1 nuclear transport factor 2 family protein [Gammaproteobacteria bacterium]
MTDRLQELIDKQDILELSYRYSRACDRLDRDLLSSVYWPDGTDDHGIFKGSAPEYVDWVIGFLEGWVATHHDNTNILIDLDGDKATGEVHWTGYYQLELDGVSHDNLAVGRYIDRYERRDGEWRILHRTCVSDWSRMQPTINDLRKNPDQSLVGKRGREDLVYSRETIGI